MRTYQINCTDDQDRIVKTHQVSCRGDLEALEKAQEFCADFGVEVWEGKRSVLWMHKGGAARLPSKFDVQREASGAPTSSSS